MSKPKGRLKQTQSRQQDRRRQPFRGNRSILFLSLTVIVLVGSSSSSPTSTTAAATATATAAIHYHVNLPKVGLISGLTIDPRGPQVEFASQQQQVVGFLGIPYAAPPIGPLRFMPPGALQQQQQQLQPQSSKQKQQLVLMPNGQRSAVRPFNRLGSRCIHLADWLSNNNKQQQQSNASRANDHQDNNQQQQQQDQFLQQQQQSEDCLNLNVFVPIKAANGNQQQTITESRSDHAQFGHQGLANHQRTTGAANTAQDSWSPLPGDSKLPILVVVQTEEADRTTANRPAAMDYPAKLALSTESIVITFNYRTGLLGFLPYADYDETGNNKGRRQSQPVRYNHAIWDQIGLLHWLKRNVHAFGGDPSTISLVGADSRASLRLQLLCMSPLAKGLFNRAVLLQRQRGCGNDLSSANSQQLDVRQLIETSGKIGRDLRQRLSSGLTEIVSNLNLSQTAGGVYETILSADVHQLAQIEHELRRKVPQKVLLMVDEPSLDDNLLFPHLGPFIDHMRPLGSSSLLRSLQSELNYCSYIRRIYQTNSNSSPEDPLHLIPLSDSELVAWNRTTNSTTTAAPASASAGSGWHRDPIQNKKPVKISVSNQQKSSSRTMAVQYFNHLNHLSSLNRILATTSQQQQQHRASGLDEDTDGAADDEVQGDNSAPAKRVERRDLRRSESGKRQHANEMQSIEDTSQLAELLSSIDLMFGYIGCSGAAAAYDRSEHQHQKVAANSTASFGSRLAESLLNVTPNEHSIDDNLVGWLKWIDFHSVLAAASSNINIGASQLVQYCDLSSLLASTMIGNGSSPATTTTGLKNSFVFVMNDDNTAGGNLLSESLLRDSVGDRFKSGLGNFIKFGDANHNKPDNQSNSWPSYNTLSREFETVQVHETEYRSMKEQLLIQLDIVPYLSEDLSKLLINQNNNRSAVVEGQHKSPVHALQYSCLGDLELDLATAAAAEQSSTIMSSTKRNCLTSSLSKLRSLTRRYAAQDLEPLLVRVTSRNNNNQVSDFGPGKSSGTSSITTRNLVNQNPDLDDETLIGGEESHNNLILTNGTNGGSLMVGRQLSGESRSALTSDESLLKKFLGITFKDTVGRALTIVVATGLVIFLVNLIIVIVMALRSSNRRSPSNNNNNNNNTSNPKTSTNKVHDSGRGPNAAAIVGKSILLQQQRPPSVSANQGNDQSQDDCLSSSDKEIPANQSMLKLTPSLLKTSSSTTSNGCPVDAKSTRPQAGRTTKQLKFNLANDPVDTEHQHQHQHQHRHQHHDHPHNQMIELSELMSNDDADSKLILDASPLLDVSQYLIPQSTYPASHLDDCATHHHHNHQQPFDLNPIDTYAILTASRGKFVQSPCNQSLTTTSASNTTSSTFRQNGVGPRKLAAMDGHADIHHLHHNHHPMNGAQAYSSHSPNSSTTLSMTPNQQTDSLNLGYPQQQQQQPTASDAPDPSTYHHHHHHNHNHNHLNSHSSTSFDVDQSQQFYMSESELFNTLKRQHKVHMLNDDPYQLHRHHNHPQN